MILIPFFRGAYDLYLTIIINEIVYLSYQAPIISVLESLHITLNYIAILPVNKECYRLNKTLFL